jgi:uncharacterized phage protein (TIGR02218 family)
VSLDVSQGGAELALVGLGETRVSQSGAEYAFKIPATTEIPQAGVEVAFRIAPPFNVTQAGAEFAYRPFPCTSKRAQIWTIRRVDGVTFRFTSLDRALTYAGVTYQSCSSLEPSASESLAEVGGAGNIELSGLVSSGAIAASELMAGLFDGAAVEAFLVPWDGSSITPQLLLQGTFSKVDFSENGFRAEILGGGARLEQTPLVKTLQPNCRWQFGDSRCKVDLDPIKVTGTVDQVFGQRGFFDPARAESAGYFSRGRVTFLTGSNAGISAEIRDHKAGGEFLLWPRLAFPISIGDTYEMIPGCTNLPEALSGTNGCLAWSNFPNFGGFPSVPGSNQISQSADIRAQKGGT